MGFYEIEQEAEEQVGDEEELEAIAIAQWGLFFYRPECNPEDREEADLIKGHGMPVDAVAQVHAEEGAGRQAIGLFGDAACKAAEATDHHGQDQGIRKQVAGRAALVDELFCDLDQQQAAEQGADDGFIGIEVKQRVMRMKKCRRVFKGSGEAREEKGAKGGADDDPDSVFIVDAVLPAAAEIEEIAKPDEEAKGFKDDMQAQACVAEL